MNRRILTVLSAAALTLTAVAASSPASAQWNRTRVQSIVDRNVTYLTTGFSDGIRYRAMVLEERDGSSLVVEMDGDRWRNRWDRRNRTPVAQVWLTGLNFGRVRIDSLNATDFRNIFFGPRALRFETSLREGDVECRIPLRRFDPRDRTIEADCQLIDGRGPVRPPAVVTPIDPRPPVIPRPHDPRPPVHDRPGHPGFDHPRPLPADFQARLIDACRTATVGNDALNRCLEQARPIGFSAPETVVACGNATTGNSALLACLGAVQADSPYAAVVIGACEDATVGNDATNQCVRTAAGARFDPVPAIQSCRDATVGNDAFQRCLQTSVR
jgi:hypothetical protein